MGEFFKNLEKSFNIAGMIVADTLVLAVVIVCISIIERLTSWLVGANSIWFGFLPVDYVFQALDLGAIIIIGGGGLLKLWRGVKDDD